MDQQHRTPASYLEMYGLSRPPFEEATTAGAFILFNAQRRAFEQLADHMVNGTGVVTLRGESGVGKTLAVTAAAQVAVDSERRVVHVSRPAAGRLDRTLLLAAIAGEKEATPEAAVAELLRPPRATLVIDDADLLIDDSRAALSSVLEQVRDRISIVLVMTAVRAAPTVRSATPEINLARLSPGEIRQYIERRLWMAGGTTRRVITQDALQIVVANAQGLPATVNRMMEAALTAGFARGDPLINRQTIVSTLGPYGRRRLRAPSIDYARLVPILSTLLLLAGIVAFLYRGLLDEPDDAPPPPSPPAATAG